MLVRVRLGTGTAALLFLPLACGAGCSDGGSAADAGGLVAADDAVVLYTGSSSGRLDPLENDTAPDGATPRVCELPPDREGGLRHHYLRVPAYLDIRARLHATVGEHEIAYTACAGGERSTATVHVTVLQRPAITVTRTSRPGLLRVTNPGDVPVALYYGHPNDDALPPDGHFRVPAGESRVFRVRRDTIDWSASTAWDVEPGFRVAGQVRGIRLPAGVEPLPDPRNPGAT